MKLQKFVYKLFRMYWEITKPTTIGVRIMLIKNNTILLVKHTYLEFWYLPGGGVKKGESFEQAIRREGREELGCELQSIKLFGVYYNFIEGKNDNVIIFTSDCFSVTGKPNNEIESYDFFAIDNLPDKVSPATRKRIEEYTNGCVSNFGIW